jgi:hypothetical protein
MSNENSTEQNGKTDIREKRIVPGTIIRLWGTGYDETFRITELITFVTEHD